MMTILEKISHETMVFMRGNYRLDEISDGKEKLTDAVRGQED